MTLSTQSLNLTVTGVNGIYDCFLTILGKKKIAPHLLRFARTFDDVYRHAETRKTNA